MLRLYLRAEDPTLEIHTRSGEVTVQFGPNALTAIDSWALENGRLSRAEAVRRLVGLGLASK